MAVCQDKGKRGVVQGAGNCGKVTRKQVGETNGRPGYLVGLFVWIHLWVDSSSPVTRMFSSSWYREGILLMQV